jgi:chromosome segregation ATPase
MNYWHRFTHWLKALLRFDSNDPAHYKKRIYKELQARQLKIHSYKNGLAELIARQQKMIVAIRKLTAEVEQLENLKHTAAVSTRDLVRDLKAKSMDQQAIRAHADYRQNLLSFQQIDADLRAKNAQIESREEQVNHLNAPISEHKSMIRQLINQQVELQQDLDEALHDIRTAQREKALYDQMLDTSGDGDEPAALKELRELRHQARAEARVARDSLPLRSAMEALNENAPSEQTFELFVGLEE